MISRTHWELRQKNAEWNAQAVEHAVGRARAKVILFSYRYGVKDYDEYCRLLGVNPDA